MYAYFSGEVFNRAVVIFNLSLELHVCMNLKVIPVMIVHFTSQILCIVKDKSHVTVLVKTYSRGNLMVLSAECHKCG